MNQAVRFHHIALQCTDDEKALFFYTEILGMKLVKTFHLSRDLSKEIFDVNEGIDVLAFQNNEMYIEVFLIKNPARPSCHHVGIQVDHLHTFIDHCRRHDVVTYSVEKGEKTLWFIKDFSGNIFEIKQK